MQNISDYNFSGKKAIVRVDFNVPLNDKFQITDDTRIRAAIPTLKKVLAGGGSLIIMSHLGRPKGPTDKYSLKHIIYRVEELLGVKIQFAEDCQKAQEQAAALKPGVDFRDIHILAATKKSQVSVVTRCMGGCVITAYLERYGNLGKVKGDAHAVVLVDDGEGGIHFLTADHKLAVVNQEGDIGISLLAGA